MLQILLDKAQSATSNAITFQDFVNVVSGKQKKNIVFSKQTLLMQGYMHQSGTAFFTSAVGQVMSHSESAASHNTRQLN